MKSKKILVLFGHPDKSGLCGQLADAYVGAAQAAGHTVDRMNVDDIQFDADLHHGYRQRQDLEPELMRFEELLKAADHFVIIHPIWWFGMPARLKGFFDRVWLPGFAFRYIKTKGGLRTMFWNRMYRGKTARIIVTSGSNPWLLWLMYGDPNKQLRLAILWFAGFKTCTAWFGPSENPPERKKNIWIQKVKKLGSTAK